MHPLVLWPISPESSPVWIRIRSRALAPVLDSRRVARRPLVPCFCACLLLHGVATAGERWTIGLSTNGVPIEAVAIAGRSSSSPTVLLVGGLERPDRSSDAVAREAATFEQLPQ